MKISLLALVSTVAAVPQYGGYGHSKFHSIKPSGTQGAEYPIGNPTHGQGQQSSAKPYPTAPGYPSAPAYPVGSSSVAYNGTAPYPTNSGSYGKGESAIDVTSTTTTTVIKTIHISPSGVSPQKSTLAGNYQTSPVANAQAYPTAGNDQCGPATVTVTAKEKVTVTVDGNQYVPTYVPAPQPSKPAESKPAEYPASSAKPVESKPAEYPASSPKPVEPVPSKADVPTYSPVPPKATPSSAAPSAAPSSAPPSTGSGYSGSKRGLVYNDAALVKNLGGKYGFAWNWGQTENNDLGGTIFIPTMHKPSDSTPEAWLANVDKAVKKGATAVMGFNECDHKEQCNMAPEQACDAWRKYMNPVKAKYPQLTIVGPSVTNGPSESGMGLSWLSKFHAACPDAIVDATNIHFYSKYDDATNNQYSYTIDRFRQQIETAGKNYGKKVWVTEYGLNAGTATPEQAASFLKQSLEYMDNSPLVQGYSYYKVGTNQAEYQLCDSNGASALGKIYASS